MTPVKHTRCGSDVIFLDTVWCPRCHLVPPERELMPKGPYCVTFEPTTRDVHEYARAQLERPDNSAIWALALDYHKTVEGEYGCPGVECPGVKRLHAFALRVLAGSPLNVIV